jgi:hypothetical protein
MPGPRHKNLFLVLAALLLVWGIFGALDVGNFTYGGYQTDGNNTVTQVTDGSPAAMAGMQAGDHMRSVQGVPVEDVRGLNRLERPAVGETWALVVERDGQELALNLRLAALPGGQALSSYIAILIGACFVLFGLWSYLKAPHPGTWLLAALGVCFGPVLLAGPYFGSPLVRNVSGAVVLSAVLMGFAVMLAFVMRAGRPDGYEEGTIVPRWIYWPAALVALMFVALLLFEPAATSGLNVAVRTIAGLFSVAYFGAALVVVIRNYLRASGEMRASRRLGLMLVGTLIGILPLTVSSLVGLLSPSTVIPTAEYWFLTLIAIPITFAIAAVAGGGSASTSAGREATA